MNADLLRGWLGLEQASWPPDPHTLLGISPEECDVARIEQRVHERLAKLRCYQISHPEEATEGMNRLAQAFVEVIDACPRETSAATSDTVVQRKTQLDWQAAPPPVRRSGPTPVVTSGEAKKIPKAAPAPNHVANTQHILHLAQQSNEARSGLGTLEAVVRRADQTRKVLIAWLDAGRWLHQPRRKVVRPADDADLSRRLDAVAAALEGYPEFLGQPGTPGYRVAATAKSPLNSLLVRGMDAEHRELLALDWANGRNLLLMHRSYLLKKFKALRRRGPMSLAMHAIRSLVNDHPVATVATFLILVVLAFSLAFSIM